MEKSIEEYKKIKDTLDEFNNAGNNDEDFMKIVQMKGVDEDLKETLILLHSNYKSEVKEQKNILYRTLYRLIDQNVEVFNKINNIFQQQQIEQAKRDKQGGGLIKTDTIHKILGAIVLTVIAFFLLALIDKHAFEVAFGALKEVFQMGGVTSAPPAAPPAQ